MAQHIFAISTDGKLHTELEAPAIAIEVSPQSPLILVLTIEGHGQVEVYAEELERAINSARQAHEAKRWG